MADAQQAVFGKIILGLVVHSLAPEIALPRTCLPDKPKTGIQQLKALLEKNSLYAQTKRRILNLSWISHQAEITSSFLRMDTIATTVIAITI